MNSRIILILLLLIWQIWFSQRWQLNPILKSVNPCIYVNWTLLPCNLVLEYIGFPPALWGSYTNLNPKVTSYILPDVKAQVSSLNFGDCPHALFWQLTISDIICGLLKVCEAASVSDIHTSIGTILINDGTWALTGAIMRKWEVGSRTRERRKMRFLFISISGPLKFPFSEHITIYFPFLSEELLFGPFLGLSFPFPFVHARLLLSLPGTIYQNISVGQVLGSWDYTVFYCLPSTSCLLEKSLSHLWLPPLFRRRKEFALLTEYSKGT